MSPSMALANELIREVRESRGFTLDTIAFHTGYRRQSINAFELGYRTVPAAFLSDLFKLTGDPRLPMLVDPCYMTRLMGAGDPGPTPPPGDPRELIPQQIASIQKHLRCLEYLERIARDGRVNDADDTAIVQYVDEAANLGEQLARTVAAVLTLRQQSGEKK